MKIKILRSPMCSSRLYRVTIFPEFLYLTRSIISEPSPIDLKNGRSTKLHWPVSLTIQKFTLWPVTLRFFFYYMPSFMRHINSVYGEPPIKKMTKPRDDPRHTLAIQKKWKKKVFTCHTASHVCLARSVRSITHYLARRIQPIETKTTGDWFNIFNSSWKLWATISQAISSTVRIFWYRTHRHDFRLTSLTTSCEQRRNRLSDWARGWLKEQITWRPTNSDTLTGWRTCAINISSRTTTSVFWF